MFITKNQKSKKTKSSSTDFTYYVHSSVSSINIDHWNSIVNYGSEFLQIPYLTALESEHPENMSFYYVIAYDNEAPIAIAYFQVVDFLAENFGSFIEQDNKEFSCVITDYLKKYFTNHIKNNVDKVSRRLLICGNAFISGEHGFTCSPIIDKKKIIYLLENVINEICDSKNHKEKISVVLIKDFYTSSKKESDELLNFKYHDFLVEPNMILDVKWKTFEDYLNAMSKKYRNRAKGIIKKGVQIERKNFLANDIIANAKQIQDLYNNVHFKAKFRLASLSVAYFVEMKNRLENKFSFTAYYYNGKIIGFKTSFLLKTTIEAHFIGLDYAINKELDLYQNILCDYVKEAIDNKSKQLVLGRTASEIKSTIGAESYELTCYIRHRNHFSNRIIKPFVDNLKPNDWVPRNPFKEI